MLSLPLLAALAGPIPLAPGTWWEYRESYTEHLEGALSSTLEEVTRFVVHRGRRGPYIDRHFRPPV